MRGAHTLKTTSRPTWRESKHLVWGDTEQAKQILLFCNYVLGGRASFLCGGAGFGSARTLPGINDSLGSGCSAEHFSPARVLKESWGFWFGVIWRVKTRHSLLQLPSPPSWAIGERKFELWGFLGCFFFGFFCSSQKDLVSPSGGGSQTRAEFIQLQPLRHEAQRWNALFTCLWPVLRTEYLHLRVYPEHLAYNIYLYKLSVKSSDTPSEFRIFSFILTIIDIAVFQRRHQNFIWTPMGLWRKE